MESVASPTVKAEPDGGMDILWREARTIFISQLAARDVKKEALRDETTLEDTLKSLKQAQEKVIAAYGPKFVGKPIEFKLGRVLQRLEFLLHIGDAAMRYSPETASYVWSAFRLVAAGFLKDFETCLFLTDSIDQMSDIIFICEIYAKRQLKKFVVHTDQTQILADKVLEKIPPLLGLVLKYAYETRKLVLGHSRIGRTVSIMFGGSEELNEIFSDAKFKRDELHKVSDIAFHEAALDILQDVHEDNKVVRKFIQSLDDELVPAVKVIQNEQLKLKEAQELERDFNEQIKWLRSGTSAELDLPRKILKDNVDRRHPGTCKWILEDEAFLNWLEKHSGPTNERLLSLMGEAGFGKSILISSIIEWLEGRETEAEKAVPIILHFFCKTGNDDTQKGNRIMLHLLLQLLHKAGEEPPKKGKSTADDESFKDRKKKCVARVKEARTATNEASGIIFKDFQAKSSMQPLLIDLAKMLERPVYVIVDALDECNDWNDGLLDALIQIADTEMDIRVLVSTRPEEDIRNKLFLYPTIDVTKASTAADVEAYITGSMKQIQRWDKEKRRTASARIAVKADGMFRYASLAVESLKQAGAIRRPFKKIMEEFPDGMAGLYTQELQTLHPDVRQYLFVALRWMVCGEGRISAIPIADELEDTFGVAEDPEAESGDEKSLKDEEGGADKESDEESDSDEDDDHGDDDDNKKTDTVNDPTVKGEGSEHGSESSDEVVHEEGRDSIIILKTASRNFLRFDKEDHVSLQHASVRDFILNESKHIHHEETLCPKCRERFASLSTIEATPKHGHLFMALHCLKTLNSKPFQKQFLPQSLLEAPKVDEGQEEAAQDDTSGEPASAEPPSETTAAIPPVNDEGADEDTENHSDSADKSVDTDVPATDGVDAVDHAVKTEDPATVPTIDIASDEDTEEEKPEETDAEAEAKDDNEAGSVAYAATDAGEDDAEAQQVSGVEDETETLRYELTHWHYHVREAEKLWPEDERNRDEWDTLYEQMDIFLTEASDVLKIWQKKVLSWRKFATFDHPMHVASRYGLLHYMEGYVKNGGDVNLANENNSVPLHLVCLGEGSYNGLELLVDHGADINVASTLDQATPLQMFVDYGGPTEKLKYLLAKGGDITLRNNIGATVLHLAVRKRDFATVKAILDQPGVDVNAQDEDGETPLHWHLSWPNGPENILQLLIERGANVNEQDKNSQAPLYEAAITENAAAAKILLEHGADVNDVEDVLGRTALHEAVFSQNLQFVRVLLEYKADVTVKDKQLHDAITLATYKDNAEILRAVLEGLKAQGGDTQALIQPDIDGQAPLHRSAARGKKDITELLLQAGDGPTLTAKANFRGNTALHSAAYRGHSEIIELLIKYGADPLLKNLEGHSPLDLAATEWRKGGILDSAEFAKTAELLTEKGPQEAQDIAMDLLDVAIEWGSIELCRLLVASNDELACKEDRYGWTPLMLAIQVSQHDIIQLLTPFDTHQLLDKFSTKQEFRFGNAPSGWSTEEMNKFNRISVSEDGLTAQRSRNEEMWEWERGLCRANNPVPFGVRQYYFEMTVANSEVDYGLAGIGFAHQYILTNNMPGWDTARGPSYGYHGDDGGMFDHRDDGSHGVRRGERYTKGDTVGCGVDFDKSTIFVTKNGKLLGDGFLDVPHGRFFPCVGLGPENISVLANFGLDPEKPFLYDVKKYDEEREKADGIKPWEEEAADA